MSWPARIASVPSQSSEATQPAHRGAVAVPRGSRRRCGGRAPSATRRMRGADPEREHERAEPGGADPPPGAEAVAVAEPGRADRGAGADVGREQRSRRAGRARSRRPATKKSLLPRTWRPIHSAERDQAEPSRRAASASCRFDDEAGSTASPGRAPAGRFGRPVASVAARTMALGHHVGGQRADLRDVGLAGPLARWRARTPCRRRPCVCDGKIARANPSSAISAMRWAWALVSCALVATRPMVVFSPARGAGGGGPARSSSARIGERAVRVAHAGDDLAGVGIDDVADGVHGDDGADDRARWAW